MQPFLLDQTAIDAYLDAGYWTRDTMAGRYAAHAAAYPNKLACRDAVETYSWKRLDEVTDDIAANLVALGIARDARALVQMASSAREVLLRIAFKKAGIIGAFVPVQWRRREIEYVVERIAPALAILATDAFAAEEMDAIDALFAVAPGLAHRIDLGARPRRDWRPWDDLVEGGASPGISDRAFAYNEVSLITVSSGTSGIAKLCQWPEAAQICVGKGIGERLRVTAEDNIGVFAPMSGAAGVLAWTVSASVPAAYTFPATFSPDALLELVGEVGITIITTVPVILARLAAEPLDRYDLSGLRALRVGTAAADMSAARRFEDASGCKVVVASGSMECPGFGHAHIDEPKTVRLDGSVGLPLPGCRLRVEDDDGNETSTGATGALKVTAPFASSGYWDDEEATEAAWSDGWYATGDMGALDADGRLTLKGRAKEVINRSGHKILPAEVEREINLHPSVFDCAVVGAPDAAYGEVPWAFVQPRAGERFDRQTVIDMLEATGMARYKIPVRFVEVAEMPRVGDNKIDKKALLEMAPAEPASA